MSGRRTLSIFERWTSALGAYTETNKVGGAPRRVTTAAASSLSVSSRGRGVTKRASRGGANQNGPVVASGVFILADVRNNGGFSARTVGVYVGGDGGVIDFLEEEDIEVVFQVSENLTVHYRFLLQVVGQKTQF